MPIATLIKTIQDIMRKDVGVDGDAQRISQIVWLLFLKIFDDKEQEWQLTRHGYKSPLQGRFRWSNWAKNPEGITGEELIDFVNNELFPALKRLATTAGVSPEGKVVGTVFEDAYNYMKSGTLLRQVINTIEDDVDFNSSSDRHLFNDIYEKILADLQSAGNAGEYYTPRAVTQFMVDILDPQLGQTILDPACGTGGFLTCTIEHLKKQVKTAEDRNAMQACIHGVEKKPLPHMLAMTNMMLHGIDVPTNIRHDNTLSRPLKDYGPKDRVDMVITNPPFGGMEEDGIENNFPRKYQTRETADLFMALIMHLLKHDTGKAAVVLPDGFLFGEGVKTTLKTELLQDFNLHTIVRLPKGVFSPYTSIKTNILFFEKGGPTKEVWFFEHPYPDASYTSYSRSRPLTIGEFDREKAWWGGPERKGRKKNEYAWKLTAKELAERNFNLDCKNPHEEEVNHRNPDELMEEFRKIVLRLESTRNALKSELVQALCGQQMKLLEKHFDMAFAATDGPRKLRQLILSVAMQGKLVPQDPSEPPASELLKQIEAEKKRLVKEGKIKPPKPLPEIKPEEAPYELPMGWAWLRLPECYFSLGNRSNQIQASDYLGDGEHPVVDQGKSFIAGYCNDSGKLLKIDRPVIVFGDHTKNIKYVDFDFIIGADGVKIICPYSAFHPRFFFHGLQSLNLEDRGYARHFKVLNEKLLPLPPLSEQNRIVAKIDQLMALCDTLDETIDEATGKQTALLNAVMAAV
jgi:type I restriction enzyme M protein